MHRNMSYGGRTDSDADTLSGSLIVEAMIDEETPLLLPPSHHKHYPSYHEDVDPKAHGSDMKRTVSDDTLVGFGEEDSLLSKPSAPSITPLPWTQLLILLALQLSEPLSSQIINPFVVEVRTVPLLLRQACRLMLLIAGTMGGNHCWG